jgi:hypothetical protein
LDHSKETDTVPAGAVATTSTVPVTAAPEAGDVTETPPSSPWAPLPAAAGSSATSISATAATAAIPDFPFEALSPDLWTRNAWPPDRRV